MSALPSPSRHPNLSFSLDEQSPPIVPFSTVVPDVDVFADVEVAIAHHWTFVRRGGEKVLEQIAELFPSADLHMLVCEQKNLAPDLQRRKLHASILQRSSSLKRHYKHLLPLHPNLIRTIKVDPSTDLLITSDAALMKSIRKPANAKHICYCHSPPRYLWEMAGQYGSDSKLVQLGLKVFGRYLRNVDRQAAENVDQFIANSQFVRRRILKAYGRDSIVVHPPVETHRFRWQRDRDAFFLVVAEMVPYKRVDLAINACNRLRVPLVVVGDGPERNRLGEIAGPTVSFRGRCSDREVTELFETAKAFLMPGVEDFGITPVEAQAAGCPVITIAEGGATETVIDTKTGLYFKEQTVDSLAEALRNADFLRGTAVACRENAERFGQRRFRERFIEVASQVMQREQSTAKMREAA